MTGTELFIRDINILASAMAYERTSRESDTQLLGDDPNPILVINGFMEDEISRMVKAREEVLFIE